MAKRSSVLDNWRPLPTYELFEITERCVLVAITYLKAKADWVLYCGYEMQCFLISLF